VLVRYGGQAENVWTGVDSGAELGENLRLLNAEPARPGVHAGHEGGRQGGD